MNLDRAGNEDEGIAAPQEPHDVETEPLNKDNTTLSMKAASALYNKVTAAKDKLFGQKLEIQTSFIFKPKNEKSKFIWSETKNSNLYYILSLKTRKAN